MMANVPRVNPGAASGEDSDMQRILQQLGLPEEVCRNFEKEKISPVIVRDLSKAELEALGVTLLGDQKRLRSACNPPTTGSAIVDEVRRVMGHASVRMDSGPLPGPSGLTFNPNYVVTRRSSRPKGSSLGQKKSTPPKKKNPIIKNLTVISYDKDMPKHFSTKSATFVISGLVEIDPESSEDHIRQLICATINNADVESLEAAEYSPSDFEFVKRSGHVFRVPDCAPGFKFNADALKTLAGQGDVYVRLTKDIPKPVPINSSADWSDDSDFESLVSTHSVPDNSGETKSAKPAREKNTSGCSAGDNHEAIYVPETPLASPESPTASPTTKKPKWSEPQSSDLSELKLEQLYQMFSNLSTEMVDLVLELTDFNSEKTVEVLLGGIRPNDILEAMSLQLLNRQSVRLTVNDQSAVMDAIAYYKRRDVDLSRPLRIQYSAGLDAGGLSKQFFSDVMLHIKDNMNAFEGPVANSLIPTYSSHVLGSGILKVLGKIIVHSLLQDGPGFPFLAPYVYHYITTESIEESLEKVTLSVLPTPVANLIYKLVNAKTEQEVQNVASEEEFIRLQTETSSVRLPNVANRHAIAHEFILHEAIVRRVAVLSQFCSGLQSLNFLEVVRRIPETFRPLFVYDEAPDISGIIISCLSFPSNMSTSEEAVGCLLKSYLRGRSQAELSKFLRFCTGSSYLPPPGYRDRLISVKFDGQAPGVATSTCINDVILPTCQAVMGSQEMFNSVMDAVQCDNGKPFNCL